MVSHQEQPLSIKRVYQVKRLLDRISVNMLEWHVPPLSRDTPKSGPKINVLYYNSHNNL
jgi:hypothetical protein